MKQDLEKWRATQRRGMLKYQENQKKKNLEKLKAGTLYPKNEIILKGQHKVPANKDTKWYKKVLWVWFSKYIRLRDSDENGICACITCGRKHIWNDGLLDAGHFIPKNTGNSIYFDEDNVNGQCRHCNKWLSGNLSKYRPAIDQKWGEGTADRLELKSREKKSFTEQELVGMINKYKIKVKQLLLTKTNE